MKNEQDYVNIILNYVNGNISDFDKKVKSLTKLELMKLIMFWETDEPLLKVVINIETSLQRSA